MSDISKSDWAFILQEFENPFEESEVSFKPQSGQYAAYIDARTVANRLNQVVGPGNWSDTYTPVGMTEVKKVDVTPADAPKNAYNKPIKQYKYEEISQGGIMCSLTIFGVTKSDVGTASMSEPLKGAVSDALKRAAVKFGIGRYLYEIGMVSTKEEGALPDWALPGARDTADSLIWKVIHENPALASNPDVWTKIMSTYSPDLDMLSKKNIYKALKAILKGN
jgi:hypothetical protein